MAQISIIIPVYNSKPYLGRLFDSLKAQTFSDWEAVCVDDGSTDGGGELLEKFSEGDGRIKVYHRVNGGLSAARNTGMEHCEGEFLAFLDADDCLHPQTLEIAIAAARRDTSDFVAYTYSRAFRNTLMLLYALGLPEPKRFFHKKYKLGKIKYLVTEDIFQWATERTSLLKGRDKRWIVKHCQVWRGLYRTERVKDIKFVPGINYEDFPWWSEVMLSLRRTTILNLPLYYYYPSRTSYILTAKQDHRLRSLEAALRAAKEVYAQKANPYQKAQWERNFMAPFEEKLEQKRRKAEKLASR